MHRDPLSEQGSLRDRAGSPPLVEGLVAVRRDVLRVAENLEAPFVGLDPVDRPVEVHRLAVGGEDVGPQVVCDARLHRVRYRAPSLGDAGHTNRQDDAGDDHAKVEALLGSPAGLLAGRELGPRNMSIVVEGRDLLPLGTLRRRAQARLRRVLSEEEGSDLGSRRAEGGRGADCKGAGGYLHPGCRASAIVRLEYTSNGA